MEIPVPAVKSTSITKATGAIYAAGSAAAIHISYRFENQISILMGHYSPGDVLLLPVEFGDNPGKKARPALVVGTDGDQFLLVCPISSHPPGDDSCLPLELEDFAEGGLDLFSRSYILTSHTCRIRKSEVIGKKGRLTREYMESLAHIRCRK